MRSYFFPGALLALLVLSFPLYAQGASEVEVTVLQIETVEAKRFEGPQYVGTDSKGRPYILRTKDGLQVYPLRDDELGKPRRIEERPVAGFGFIIDAAMNRHGDWLVLDGYEARLFKGGKEVILPALPWKPSAVTLLDGDPVALVFPFPMVRMSREERRHPPLLITAGKDEWRTLVDSDLGAPPERDERTAAEQQIAAKLFADSDDTLWVANHYRYRVVRYSKSGRELLSIEVDGAEVGHHDEVDLEDARVGLEEERAKYANPEKARIVMNTATEAILDLAEGEDGRIYLLTKGGEGGSLTLDRYDGVLGTLERAALGVSTPGQASIASGKDGIYVVPFNGKEKRHLVPWEEIETAVWVPVEGVKINGADAVTVVEGE